MRAVVAAVLCVALAACATTEVSVVLGARRADGDAAPGALLTVSQRIGKRMVCSYAHISDPSSGKPFNDRPEVSDDFGGCGWTWRGGR